MGISIPSSISFAMVSNLRKKGAGKRDRSVVWGILNGMGLVKILTGVALNDSFSQSVRFK